MAAPQAHLFCFSRLHPLLAVATALLLSACAQMPAQKPVAAAPATTANPIAATESAPEKVAATPAENLPEVNLSEKILYQLLMSEIAAQRGMQDAAFATELSLANETRDPRLARRATEFAWSLGQAQAALQAARLWQELSPDSAEAASTVMTILVASNRFDEAEPMMRYKINNADVPLQAFAQIHSLVSRSPNRVAVSSLLQRLGTEAKLTRLPEVHLMLAQSAQNAGDKAKAAEELQIASMLKPDWDLATILLAQYQLADTPAQAEATLTTYLSQHPKSVEVRLAYARLLVNALRNKEAEVQFQRLLKEDSGKDSISADFLFTLGQLAYQGSNPDSAESFFKRFLERRKLSANKAVVGTLELNSNAGAPSPNGAYLFLAQIAEDRKNEAQALDWLAQIQDGGEYVGAQIQRAKILARTGRMNEARQLLQDVNASSEGERTQLTIAEAQLLRENKLKQESFELLAQALQHNPENPELLYDHAMAAVAVNKLDAMETSLRELIRLRPTYPHGYNALGYTLADHNLRLQEARTLIEKALSLAPDDASIIDSMGWVQYRLGNYTQAVEQLQRAYQLRQDADVAVHLGEALWASGRRAEAEQFWVEASRKEPDNESLRQTLLRLNVNLGALTPAPQSAPQH